MYDAKPQIYKKLSEIEGVKVTTFWNDGILHMPCIIYTETNNTPADPTRTLYRLEYNINIFTRNEGTYRLANEVEIKMWELGFTCESSMELPDERGVYHRRLSFMGIINTDNDFVYTN